MTKKTTKKETKFDFENKMTIRVDILRTIATNYTYYDFLFNNDPKEKRNFHWANIRFNFFRLLFIDLAQLFVEKKDTHKLNIFTLLNSLETGHYRNLGVQKNRTDHYRKELNKYKNFFLIIEKYRNQLFVHTEILAAIKPDKLFFSQSRELINLTFEFLNEISETISKKSIVNSLEVMNIDDFKIS